MVYGTRGLGVANPQVRGGTHAWIGLVCGALFGLFNLRFSPTDGLVVHRTAVDGRLMSISALHLRPSVPPRATAAPATAPRHRVLALVGQAYMSCNNWMSQGRWADAAAVEHPRCVATITSTGASVTWPNSGRS